VKKGGDGPDWLSRPFLLAISAVIVVLAIVLGFFFAKGSSGDAAFVAKLEQAQKALPKDLQNGTKLGKDDAPVKLVSYEDFQCPFCLQYTANQEGELIEKYVKTGEVQLEFRNLTILGQESVRAAIAGAPGTRTSSGSTRTSSSGCKPPPVSLSPRRRTLAALATIT